MTRDEFIDILDCPYAEEAMAEFSDDLEPASSKVLQSMPYGTAQEIYDYLLTGKNFKQADERDAARTLAALISGAERVEDSIWDRLGDELAKQYIRHVRHVLRTGNHRYAYAKNADFPGSDYAHVLKLHPGQDMHHPEIKTVAFGNEPLDWTIDELTSTEEFYILPTSSKTFKSDITHIEYLFKCKEHPDLVFIWWDNGRVSMTTQADLLKFLVPRNYGRSAESIKRMLDGDTLPDDFEPWQETIR